MPFHVDMSLSMGINQSAYEKNEWPALVPCQEAAIVKHICLAGIKKNSSKLSHLQFYVHILTSPNKGPTNIQS